MSIDLESLEQYAESVGICFHALKVVYIATEDENCIFSHETIPNLEEGVTREECLKFEIKGQVQYVHGELCLMGENFYFTAYKPKEIVAKMKELEYAANYESVKSMVDKGNLVNLITKKKTEGVFTSTWFYASIIYHANLKKAYSDLSKIAKSLQSIANDSSQPGAPFNALKPQRSEPSVGQNKEVSKAVVIVDDIPPKKKGKPKASKERPSEPTSKRQRVDTENEPPAQPKTIVSIPTPNPVLRELTSKETPTDRFEIILGQAKTFQINRSASNTLAQCLNLWKPESEFGLAFLVNQIPSVDDEIRILFYSLSICVADGLKKKKMALELDTPEIQASSFSDMREFGDWLKSLKTIFMAQNQKIKLGENLKKAMANEEHTLEEWKDLILNSPAATLTFFECMKKFGMEEKTNPNVDKTLYPRTAAITYAMLNNITVEIPSDEEETMF
jgi:hypothetical protein